MSKTDTYVASQQLFAIHGHLGDEFFKAIDMLTNRLKDMPRDKRTDAPREYAELREAKTLISYMRYPDATLPIRRDELAWALGQVTDQYRGEGQHAWAGLLEQSANLLGIDLLESQPMPADLDRRIKNELSLVSRTEAA